MYLSTFFYDVIGNFTYPSKNLATQKLSLYFTTNYTTKLSNNHCVYYTKIRCSLV